MKKYYIPVVLMFLACEIPTEPKQVDDIDEMEMTLGRVVDKDVPVDSKDKKGKKASFRKVIYMLEKYLTNNPNEEVQALVTTATFNLEALHEMKKAGVKDGFMKLVKETRNILKKAIMLVKKDKGNKKQFFRKLTYTYIKDLIRGGKIFSFHFIIRLKNDHLLYLLIQDFNAQMRLNNKRDQMSQESVSSLTKSKQGEYND